jgi:formate dehydrogenase
VVFLASDEASFVFGAELHVDGGYTALGHVRRAADGSHVAGDEQPQRLIRVVQCPPLTRSDTMATILCVLYDDPVDGYPPDYSRDSIPTIERYPDGQTTPTPDGVDFTPGELLGCVSGALGLRGYAASEGHELVVTSDKDGEDSELDRNLADAEVVISQPFWPAYMTAERIAKAPNLKLIITAGIGSDHTDLQAAIERGVTVAEVTYCNSISVSEHVVMMILSLVRNYIPMHQIVLDGGWNIADAVSRSYDLEGMQVGTVAAGRIGTAVLKRLKPFDVGLHYTDRHRLPAEVEEELGATFHESPEDMVPGMDVVTINCPLHPETEHMFDDEMISKMRRGAYIVNTARGKICDRDAIARALESGQLAGYAGDVWFPQPAPRDHPWRTMPHHGMTPHTSGSSLSAQARYAAGTREILECHFGGRPIREEYLIVQGGALAGAGAHSYSEGDATGGSEEAARFST